MFAAVAEEVGRLLRVEVAAMVRYEPDGTRDRAWRSGADADARPASGGSALDGRERREAVCETGGPPAIDDYDERPRPVAAHAHDWASGSSVGCPIVVEGRLWGAMIAASRKAEPLPADTESRIGEFTELVATAIVEHPGARRSSPRRGRGSWRRPTRSAGGWFAICTTARSSGWSTRSSRSSWPSGASQNEERGLAAPCWPRRSSNAEQATAELRELAHGILPAVLTHGGLRAGVDALASRTPVPVEIDVSVDRLPAAVEATAYFVVAEALTNVAKHARAGRAEVDGADRGRHARGPGARRRRRRRPARRERARGARRPARRPRRPAPGREPGRRRHARRRGDPAARRARRGLTPGPRPGSRPAYRRANDGACSGSAPIANK